MLGTQPAPLPQSAPEPGGMPQRGTQTIEVCIPNINASERRRRLVAGITITSGF